MLSSLNKCAPIYTYAQQNTGLQNTWVFFSSSFFETYRISFCSLSSTPFTLYSAFSFRLLSFYSFIVHWYSFVAFIFLVPFSCSLRLRPSIFVHCTGCPGSLNEHQTNNSLCSLPHFHKVLENEYSIFRMFYVIYKSIGQKMFFLNIMQTTIVKLISVIG